MWRNVLIYSTQTVTIDFAYTVHASTPSQFEFKFVLVKIGMYFIKTQIYKI